MNWLNAAAIGACSLVLVFAVLRAERRRLWVVLIFLVVPILWLVNEWARSSPARWLEIGIGAGAALVIAGLWWLAVGRRLPAPTTDNIKVWGQETAPRPKPAQLLAELDRLREENERLAAELKRLGGGERAPDNGRQAADD